MEKDVEIIIHCGLFAIDEDAVRPAEILDEASGGVDVERSAADDKNIAIAKLVRGFGKHRFVKRLFVKHDIGFDETTAIGTMRHAFRGQLLAMEKPIALRAKIPFGRAMQLINALRARFLMKAIDVLSQDDDGMAFFLIIRQGIMGGVRLSGRGDHRRPIEVVKALRVAEKIAVGEHDFVGNAILRTQIIEALR